MKESQNILDLATLPIDLMGFIFYAPSKRFCEPLDMDILAKIRKNILKTGVFVNENQEFVLEKIQKYKLDAVQLHGQESPEFCKLLQAKNRQILKVFSMDSDFDFSQLKAYESVCEYFLFDTKTPQHGGSGQKFDWNLLENPLIQKPFFLSGGIDLEDIKMIKSLKNKHLAGIDLNSKFEISPALKDIEKLRQFFGEFVKV